ncbi:girdin-like [Mercenaria mercenaria]|uniref:girdin-like n=1 Tax=Mercenaria mercenaria TaxID=6596 RepID=UPI001E1D9DC0|nr:girdin-like [Mercenaria mercenaria]
MDSKRGGLTEKEMSLLRRHWKTLKQDIRMGDIVDHLIVEDVLKPATWEDLKRKYNIEKERTEEFLLLLQRKPSKCFVIFQEALRDAGYDHLADKLEVKDDRTQKKKPKPDATAVDNSFIMKTLKELCDRDKQKEIQLAAMKQDQEKTSQRFEKKLALNLQQTNEELDKLKTSLRQKEDEIEKLKQIQRQQEETNKELSEENKKLENEREQMFGELQLTKSEKDEVELKMKRQKMYEDRIVKEKEKLKKTVERQSTQLEQEMQEKKKAMDHLKRESTALELIKKEKKELQEKIEKLEDENEVLSARPYSSMTRWTLSTSRDMDSSSTTLYRRQPTGLSQSDDNNSMSQLLDQRGEIEAEIKRKQIEQKHLRRRLRELKSHAETVESQTCVVM